MQSLPMPIRKIVWGYGDAGDWLQWINTDKEDLPRPNLFGFSIQDWMNKIQELVTQRIPSSVQIGTLTPVLQLKSMNDMQSLGILNVLGEDVQKILAKNTTRSPCFKPGQGTDFFVCPHCSCWIHLRHDISHMFITFTRGSESFWASMRCFQTEKDVQFGTGRNVHGGIVIDLDC